MTISKQMEAVYRRALLLRQYVVDSPVPQDLLEKALQELHFVLEELQTSQDELHQQNQALIETWQTIEVERQRYQTLFELAPNGYLVTDLQGNIYQVNHYAAAKLFCIPQEYLLNKPLLALIHEPDRPYFQTQLAHLTPGKDWEVRFKLRDKAAISVAITVTRIQDTQQRKEMLLWALYDITLRNQMSQQLQSAHDELEARVAERTAELSQANAQLQQEIHERQQAEQKIRDQAALIDIATDAIFVQDLEQRIVFWNQGAERLYGWTAADILGKPASLLFSQDSIAQLSTGCTQTMEQGSWQAELDQVTHIGKPIIVQSRWTVVRGDTGPPQSILVVNTDITDKKRLEAQFYRAQRIESLGTLTSGIAHDLNNILTPIVGLAQLQLLHQPSSDQQSHEIWKIVQSSAQRGAELVQQITLFAKGISGQQIPVKAGELLLNISKMIRQTFPKSIQICTHIQTNELWSIAADPTQLHQVIMNLCVNARDAMPKGGTLTLGIENCSIDATYAQKHLEAEVGNYVVITISDTGEGIPAALMERIFEPFFTTKAPGKGTGLGLATVFRIVKNHGGFIELSSQEGKGTQFQVYLPVVQEIPQQNSETI